MPTPTRRRAADEPKQHMDPASVGYAFLGLDPGLSGGLAIVTPECEHAWPTPVAKDARGRRQFDREAMVGMLRPLSISLAAIERVDAAPMRGRRQGTTSMFNFGSGYGLWLGILQALGIPYVEVPPKVWKRVILKGMGTDKAAAIEYCRRFRPLASLRPPRSRVDHTGIADAVCLAEYAMREYRIREAMGTN